MNLIFRVDDEIRVPAKAVSELGLPHDRVEPVNLWLELPIGGGAWTAAYRIVLTGRDRSPVIGEVRIFPTESNFTSDRAAGEWSARYRGIAASLPPRGVTGGLVKEIKVSTIIRQLDGAVALTAAQHPELATIWPRWKGQLLGRRQPRKRRSTRGRKPHPAWFLATVAKQYVHALRVEHVNPVPYIAAQHREQSLSRIRTWVFKAREAGYLIGRREAGKAGGALSPTAELVLKEHERNQRWEKL